jgi:hypothetical protein
MSIIENLESIFYYILIMIIASILFLFIRRLKYMHWVVGKVHHHFAKYINYNLFIRFTFESYLEFSFCSLINFYEFTRGTKTYNFNAFMSIIIFIIVNLFPIGVFLF